jgi:AcrR family transcriptional regulator
MWDNLLAVGGLRDDILSAAAHVACSGGLSSLNVAGVASAAGVSRPTVYKHVGDAERIVTALIEWEVERFFEAVTPLMQADRPIIDRFVDALRFTVEYAESSELLQALLRREGETTLPLFTTRGQPLIGRGVDLFLPYLEVAQAAGEIDVDDLAAAAEWGVRVAVSLVLTPALNRGVDSHDRLRGFASELLRRAYPPSPPTVS